MVHKMRLLKSSISNAGIFKIGVVKAGDFKIRDFERVGVKFGGAAKLGMVTAGIILASGCGSDRDPPTRSSNTPTSDIRADIRVLANGSGMVRSSVELTADSTVVDPGNSASVRLDGSDEIWISTGEVIDANILGNDLFSGLSDFAEGQARYGEITETIYVWGGFWGGFVDEFAEAYSADIAETEVLEYRVTIYRNGERIDNLRVTLPEPFEVNLTTETGAINREDSDVVLTWDNPQNNTAVDITLASSCQYVDDNYIEYSLASDEGRFSFNTSDLNIDDNAGTCRVKAVVDKVTLGEYDAKLRPGIIEGVMTRSVSFSL